MEDFDRDPDRFLEAPTIDGFTALADHDPAGLLAAWWGQYAGSSEPDAEEATPHPETAPFGRVWPGTVPAVSLAEGAAAEHFAFCPDLVWQGGSPHTLRGYAERLVDRPVWSFWWD